MARGSREWKRPCWKPRSTKDCALEEVEEKVEEDVEEEVEDVEEEVGR
jgi:hypothetical protein